MVAKRVYIRMLLIADFLIPSAVRLTDCDRPPFWESVFLIFLLLPHFPHSPHLSPHTATVRAFSRTSNPGGTDVGFGVVGSACVKSIPKRHFNVKCVPDGRHRNTSRTLTVLHTRSSSNVDDELGGGL